MLRILALCLLALSEAACARPASISAMTTGDLALPLTEQSPLTKAICVGVVQGGEETNPLWISTVNNEGFRGALRNSLRVNRLAAREGECRFDLDAHLTEISKPLIGVSFTVTAEVAYALRRTGEAATQFETKVAEPYTAKFSDALIGAERLAVANEGAIRTSIATLLMQLATAPLAEPTPAADEGVDVTAPSS